MTRLNTLIFASFRLDIVDCRVWPRRWVTALLVAGALFFEFAGVSAQTAAITNKPNLFYMPRPEWEGRVFPPREDHSGPVITVAGKAVPRSVEPVRTETAGGLHPETQGRSRFFPVVAQPARKLIAVDVGNAPADDRLLLLSLQGLVNRKRPRIYLIPDSKWIGDGKHEPPAHRRDEFWLNWLIEKGLVKETERLHGDRAGLASLLKRFRSFYRGAVIPDPELPVGKNMAVTIAGVEDLLICTPALAAQYGLPVKMDLRGRFPSNHEAMEWVWSTYRDRLNPQLLASANPRANRGLAWAFSGDYYVQNRAFVFWVTGKESVGKPFCNAEKEKAVVERILGELPPNIPVCGFTWAGEGEGLGEYSGVKMISEWGNVLVPVGIPNLSVHSGFRLPGLKQNPRRATPELDSTKAYVALTTSDGDALLTFYNFYVDWFQSLDHGRYPVGIGMGPAALDLIPALAAWHYERAAPTDEFFCEVSGIGYMYPEFFASRRPDRDRVAHDFLRWTSDYMNRMDLRGIRPYGASREWLERYAGQINNLQYLIPGYGKQDGMSYAQAVYETSSRIPVFHALTPIVAPGMKQTVLKEIKSAAGSERPVFINAFVNATVNNWSFLYDVPWIVDNMGPDFVFVTPGELSVLFRQARRSGPPRKPAQGETKE